MSLLDETKLILLVEDNPDDEALTLRAFARNNISRHVVVVRDGAEALAWLFKRNEHQGRTEPDPQVVLLDLELPTLGGLEVLRQIRADPRMALMPVVIFTASKSDTDLALAYELHANSYIQKPVEFGRFVEVVREIGLYWLGLNESPLRGPRRVEP